MNKSINTRARAKAAIIMAGGTGGHVIPGLEIAKKLKDLDYHVSWLGTKAGIESKLVPNNNIEIFYLPIWGVRGKKLIYKLIAPFRIFISIIYSFFILLKIRPDFVLGMGGFASGPGGIAAWLLRIPLIIHEQNATLCMTNKILKKFSSKVLISFPNLMRTLEQTEVENVGRLIYFTGNPVRNDIINLLDPALRWQKKVGSLKVLVLGGSRGAMILNQTVPYAIAKLPVSQRPEIWHQAGKDNYEDTLSNYQKLGLKVKVDSFIDNMAEAYAWADLVIARSGALTIAEITAAGLPALLIPYPYASDNHQKLNADFLVSNNAAVMLEQKKLTVEVLSETLLNLINSRPQLLEMAISARKLSMSDATNNIIKHCQEVAINASN